VADIANKEVGAFLTLTGTFATALQVSNAGAAVIPSRLIIPIGSISLDCAASNTGSVKWVLNYVPLDDGASVAAA
jgi:hypothetical protein